MIVQAKLCPISVRIWCTCGKSYIVRKQEVHPNSFNDKKKINVTLQILNFILVS